MAWTSPATWNPGQIVSATDLNTQLRDNLSYLLSRPNSAIKRDNNANYTTTSTSFVDVDATNLKITLTVSGSAVLVGFSGVSSGNLGRAAFDVLINSTRYASAGADGLVAQADASMNYGAIGFCGLITGLTPGSHVFKLQWKALSSTANLTSGNGTGGQDFHPDILGSRGGLMRELTVMLNSIQPGALDTALRTAVPGKIIGISTYGPDRLTSIWLDNSAAPADETAATNAASAHDPVFLSVDKPIIAADGVDTATVIISAPNPGAVPVTLLVAGAAVPVTLTNGLGTLAITSADPASIAISVQNPANRSTDQLVIQAV